MKRILIGTVSYCKRILCKHGMPNITSVLMSHSFAFALHLDLILYFFTQIYLQYPICMIVSLCHHSNLESPSSPKMKEGKRRNVALVNRVSKTNQIRMNESHFVYYYYSCMVHINSLVCNVGKVA